MTFLNPNAVLLTGVEPDPDEPEFDRVYVGPRYNWNYVLAKHGEVSLNFGHTYTVLDPNAKIYHDAKGKAEAARQFAESWKEDLVDYEVVGA